MSFMDFLLHNFQNDFNNAITGYAVEDSFILGPNTTSILIVVSLILILIIIFLFFEIRNSSKPSLKQLYRYIFESQTAINYNNLDLAKTRYLEAMDIYNTLSKSQKARVYPLLSEVFKKRKQAEQKNLNL